MPVGIDMQITNLKALERAWKKDVKKIQRELTKEAGFIGGSLDREIRGLVRSELLSYGYSSNGIDRILDGIRVLQYAGKGIRIYSRVKVTLQGGGWANVHLGAHTDRTKKNTSGASTGRLKPDRLNLDVYVDRTAPKFKEIAERITKRVLELKTPGL